MTYMLVLMISVMSWKAVAKSHPLPLKAARGVGKAAVEGFSSLREAGTAFRAKAQILMPADVHSVT